MFKLFKILSESEAFSMCIETSEGIPHEVKFEEGQTILEAAIRAGVEIPSSCASGTCGTCRIELLEGADSIEPPNEIECETARDKRFQKNERLACQILAKPGVKARVP